MGKKIKCTAFLFITLLWVTNLQAQEMQFGLDVQLGVPQKEYKTQLGDRLGFGLGGMFGREAEYLREGSIIRENGNVTFDVVQSTTDLLYFKLGVTVGF